jgi:hypothetical protein
VPVLGRKWRFRPVWPDCINQIDLLPMPRGPGIQGRDQLFGCWGDGDSS